MGWRNINDTLCEKDTKLYDMISAMKIKDVRLKRTC